MKQADELHEPVVVRRREAGRPRRHEPRLAGVRRRERREQLGVEPRGEQGDRPGPADQPVCRLVAGAPRRSARAPRIAREPVGELGGRDTPGVARDRQRNEVLLAVQLPDVFRVGVGQPPPPLPEHSSEE